MLAPEFPIAELQKLYEAVLERDFAPETFRKSVLKTGLVIEADRSSGHGAPRMYCFGGERGERSKRRGILPIAWRPDESS
jgi:hypothetical protein